jgi:hypothetical protein
MRYYLSKVLVLLIRVLNWVDFKLTNYKYSYNPNFYEDLAPIDNIDDTHYIEALDWALRNSKVTNIALTAPYGAGKSSILRTFEKNHKQYKYLNISLATFKDDGDLDNASIEKSILQQMIYRVKTSEIPKSRFKRIIKTKYLFFKSTVVFIWVVSIITVFKPKMFNMEIFKNLNMPDSLTFFAFIIFIIGSFLITYRIIKTFSTIKLHKINLQNPEIEIGNETDSDISILNKHLDEVLYFFEVTQYDVVVIEDLDRFEKPEIFTKLRELNALINNSKQINRRIVFIYAIKDNMFKDENRTKFFEFMIPVIPIINSSNSIEILQKKIDETNLSELLTGGFISDISLYISDMRMLKNIYNEFMLYKNKLSNIDINLNKLFAMIIYKNIYPSDFANLHDDKGMVYNVFISKKREVDNSIKELEVKIKELKEEIQSIEEQALDNVKELRAVYIQVILEKITNIQKIAVNGSEKTFLQLKEDAIFNQLKQETNIQYIPSNGYQRIMASALSFKLIENEINKDLGYDDREKLILAKEEEGLESIKIKIEELQKLIQTTKSATVKEFIENFGEKDIFDEKIVKEKLLVYLLRHGYIDEMYHSLISYFFEGSMTKEDMDFVLSIKNQEYLGSDYKLVKIEKLLKRIRLNEFLQKEVLNYELFDFIIEHRNNYGEQLDYVFEQLTNEHEMQVQFIDGYLERGKHQEYFVNTLSKRWSGMWKYIDYISQYSREKKDNYLGLLIMYADTDDIISMNSDLVLSNYISQKSNFFSLNTKLIYQGKIKEMINGLNVKFENIDNPAINQNLFDYIYSNNFYMLNERMIQLMLDDVDVEEFTKCNYTTILSADKPQLQNYIKNNIEEYIENVFLKLDTNHYENEDVILQMLNNEEISNTNKEKIIVKEETILTSITDVPMPLWDSLFRENKIKATWINILYFLQNKEKFNTDLITFLNIEENYIILSQTEIQSDETFNEEFVEHISLSILLATNISEDSFTYLIKSIPYTYDNLDFEKVSPR